MPLTLRHLFTPARQPAATSEGFHMISQAWRTMQSHRHGSSIGWSNHGQNVTPIREHLIKTRLSTRQCNLKQKIYSHNFDYVVLLTFVLVARLSSGIISMACFIGVSAFVFRSSLWQLCQGICRWRIFLCKPVSYLLENKTTLSNGDDLWCVEQWADEAIVFIYFK